MTKFNALLKRYQWILAGILVAFLLTFPLYAGSSSVRLLTTVFIYSLSALGLMLIFGFSGMMCAGFAAFYGTGAYVTAILATKLGLPFTLCFLASGVVTGLIGFLICLPCLRLSADFVSLISTALLNIFLAVVRSWQSVTNGASGIVGIPHPSFFGYEIKSRVQYYYMMLITAVIIYLLVRNVLNSKIGLTMKGVRDNEIGTIGVGVKSKLTKLLVFTMGSFIGGLGGSLYCSYISAVTPDNFVFAVSTTFVQMCVIGGLGTLPGAIIGTVFVTLLPELFRDLALYRLGVGGLVMIIMMVVRPQGIAGSQAFAGDFTIVDRIRQKKMLKQAKMESGHTPAR